MTNVTAANAVDWAAELFQGVWFEVLTVVITLVIVMLTQSSTTKRPVAPISSKKGEDTDPGQSTPKRTQSRDSLGAALDELVTLAARRSHAAVLELYKEIRTQPKALRAAEAAASHSLQDVYTQVVCCAVRLDKPSYVKQVIEDMQANEVPRTATFYESTMKMLAAKRLFPEALAIYDQMVVEGIPPSPDACSCMINFHVESGNVGKAMEHFRNSPVDKFRPFIRGYVTMLKAFMRSGPPECVIELLGHMEQRGVSLDTVALNIALSALVNPGETQLAWDTLEKYHSLADLISYNTVVKGLVRTGEEDKAWGLLEVMRERGFEPNLVTYRTIAAVRGKYHDQARAMLRQMRPDR
mmetsp:Transcript_47131/g.102551  ORF Transcript_47131/g.102551 Transcript_47131/m.102551 type:complete len:354 (-) Transcript_47131:92-1153(-)